MTETSTLRRWVDLTVHMLTRPQLTDPWLDMFAAFAEQLPVESGGTVDYGREASRIRVFGDLGPTADSYEPVLGYHPLARYFVATGDRRPATMQVARRYVAEPGVAALVAALRADGMADFIFAPVLPRPGYEHRWLVLSGSHPLREAERRLCEDIGGLILAVDAQASVLADARRHVTEEPAAGLTAREATVLALLADGLTAVAVAHRLGTSPRTVAKHQGNIYRKLGVHDRLTAVLVAQQIGVLRAQPHGRLAACPT